MSGKKGETTPREAVAVESLLKAQGASGWERCVVSMLLEFAYRHVASTLDEAQTLALHRTREASAEITLADVQLAAHNALTHCFTEPLGGAELDALVKPLNQTPLPPVPFRAAVTVAAEAALLSPTYCVRSCDVPRVSFSHASRRYFAQRKWWQKKW